MSNLNGIWVVGEHYEGALESITFELLGKARELGSQLNQPVGVVLMGNGVTALASGLGNFGADKVYVIDRPELDPYRADVFATAFADLLGSSQPMAVLFGATSVGRDIAALTSAKLGTGVVNDVSGIRIEGGELKLERPIFGGNALTTLIADPTKTQLITAQPKAFEKASAGAGKAGEIVTAASGADSTSKMLIKGFLAEVASGKINLNEAEIVVAGGRGVGGADKFAVIEELASALGAAVGASRAVTDAGWRPANEQIGQTGITIKPKLYICAGISGAVQHWVGMKESGYIVAINTDAEAPIMKMADLAIVGDLFKVIPEMVSEIKAARAAAV